MDPHDPAHVTERRLTRDYLVWLAVVSGLTLAGMIACVLIVRWLWPETYQKLHF